MDGLELPESQGLGYPRLGFNPLPHKSDPQHCCPLFYFNIIIIMCILIFFTLIVLFIFIYLPIVPAQSRKANAPGLSQGAYPIFVLQRDIYFLYLGLCGLWVTMPE